MFDAGRLSGHILLVSPFKWFAFFAVQYIKLLLVRTDIVEIIASIVFPFFLFLMSLVV